MKGIKKLKIIYGPNLVLLAVMACIAGGRLLAANNPLNTILAESCEAKSGAIKTEACIEGGANLSSIHNGDYILYKSYDFDSGVAAFKARVAAVRSGSLEIRLDSLTGPLAGSCSFENTGGWQNWRDVSCQVDNSQAGVRNLFLVFRGNSSNALVNIKSFVFLKSIPSVSKSQSIPLSFSNRVDVTDDELQSTNVWGMPENGFADDFESQILNHWDSRGISVTSKGLNQKYSAQSLGTNFNFAFTPNVYINKTDTGGEWRTLAQGALSTDIIIDSPNARPGIGFCSKNANAWICVTLNAANNSIETWQKLPECLPAKIKEFTGTTNNGTAKLALKSGVKYQLQLDWSPYSGGLIVFLKDNLGNIMDSFRTVIDLPMARRPMLICSEGNSRFDDVKFDPTVDDWNLKWQWKKVPILASDVCNPAVWKAANGKYYMMWRKFGADNYHGIISSDDGVAWTRVKDEVLKCTGDMNVVVDPFDDGLVYVTPGGGGMPWWTSDGSNDFTVWKDSGLKLGSIFGNNRIQEIIDTKKYSQLKPVSYAGVDYRFIAFTENWIAAPKPHTVILLSNTLTNWILANPEPVIPPGTNFWGEKGNAIGSAIVLPDGNILVAVCACTHAGYTGAPEPSNITAIVDGKKPWKILKLGILPDAPVSREHVWYEGPNFGTALYYEPKNDTLFFYGGFHDYYIGMMRVEYFMRSKLFHP